MRIVLIGPPGSGKGTQAKKLHKKFEIPHISSGDILRDEVARKTEFGMKVKAFMDRGEIGPTELITKMVLDYIDKKCPSGFILDGFPRTVYQAEQLEKHQSIIAVIAIEVSEDEVIRRITGRRSCPDCGAIYHAESKPPKKKGTCDDCGSKLVHRDDDSVSTVKNRLNVYNTETKPVIDYYEKKGLLRRVNGARDPEEIYLEIMRIV
jgi:adenylate kinase